MLEKAQFATGVHAVELKCEDWSYAHVWFYLPVFYLLGLMFARRRYP